MSSTLAVTSSQLIELLKRCCNSKAISPGKQIHRFIINIGLNHNPFVLTKLLQFYADSDHFSYARKLFDEIPRPNIFSWTAILAFHSRNSDFQNCLLEYREMRLTGLAPDCYVFPVVLRACARWVDLDMGALVHKDVVVFGAESSSQASNSLIGMYSRFGDVGSARQVFDGMDGRQNDLLSWNSMISGCVSNGFYDLAVELAGAMELDGGVDPDVVTWNSVMDAYCRSGDCDMALEVFARIKEPSVVSWTTLVSGLSRIGRHGASLEIFKDMLWSGKIVPDLDSLSSAMASSRFLHSPNSAQEIHAYGIKLQNRKSLYMCVGPALLTAYTRNGRIRDAESVFALMDKSDVVTWNAMIQGCVELGMEDMAIEYFAKMKLMGIKSDQTTLSIILPICDLQLGKQVHGYILRNWFYSEILIINALICMYSRCGGIDLARLLFSKMETRDLVSWNTILGGLAMHGRGKEALKLLQKMKSSGHSPDSFTITSALSACSHSGLVDEGLELFNHLIKEASFTPKSEHIGCVVDMLSRAGRVSEAIELLKAAPVTPNRQTWGALLVACQMQMNIEGAKLAVENLQQLEPENVGHHVTIANMYAGGGRWEDEVKVRKVIEQKGLVKMMGVSRIEPGK